MELADALSPAGASLDASLLLSGDLQQFREGEWAMYKSRDAAAEMVEHEPLDHKTTAAEMSWRAHD
jgi:hypothetical protein